MINETSVTADYLGRIFADIGKDIHDLNDGQVNLKWPIEDANTFATSGGFDLNTTMSVRGCVMRVIEHSATHLGHVQLARQIVLKRGSV